MIEKCEDAGIKNLDDPSTFIEYSNTMDNVYNNIDDYNLRRKTKILIVFDDMIADIMTSKKCQAIIKELFIRCRKLNISLVFITVLFFCSKRSQIEYYTLPNNENSQQKRVTTNCY